MATAPGVEIVATPIGDAPLKVRQAWIGLVLPLHSTSLAGPVTVPGLSVFAAGHGWRTWWRWLLRRPYPTVDYTGYVVPSAQAISILALTSPDAANWWRQHAPAFLHAKSMFIFDVDCCRPVDLPDPADSSETPL